MLNNHNLILLKIWNKSIDCDTFNAFGLLWRRLVIIGVWPFLLCLLSLRWFTTDSARYFKCIITKQGTFHHWACNQVADGVVRSEAEVLLKERFQQKIGHDELRGRLVEIFGGRPLGTPELGLALPQEGVDQLQARQLAVRSPRLSEDVPEGRVGKIHLKASSVRNLSTKDSSQDSYFFI